MSLLLETSAGYVDSEYSDYEQGHPLSTIRKSSPKFGSDNLGWSINRKVPEATFSGQRSDLTRPIRRLGHIDFDKYDTYCQSSNSLLNGPDLAISDDIDIDTYEKDDNSECAPAGSCKTDVLGNELKWWCDEQEVSDFSISNTCEDVTPIKLNLDHPEMEKKVLGALQSTQYDDNHQMSDRTRCGSGSSDGSDYNDLLSVSTVTKSPRLVSEEHEEWSSFMKPADNDEEVETLRQQILQRLGFKLDGVKIHKTVSKKDVPRCNAAVQTSDDTVTTKYSEYELKWLRDVNEILVAKLIEIMNSGKLMAYKTEQNFIETLQSHLERSQNEIDRLLNMQPEPDNASDDKQELVEEISLLKDDNDKLRKEVESLRAQLLEVTASGDLSDRAKVLEKKLQEEKTSKKVLMDDFTKTLGYMRMMKDRLKTLSHEKGDRKLPAQDEKVEVAPSKRLDPETNRKHVRDTALKGCIKRSNTTACTPSKPDRVKFAETSDVYYLPKRSNSELGPFVADTNKQLPILPCKIGPTEPKNTAQESCGFFNFFKNIKQTFTSPSKPNGPRVNVLKVPTNQRSQTQQQLDMYKKHLVSRGLHM